MDPCHALWPGFFPLRSFSFLCLDIFVPFFRPLYSGFFPFIAKMTHIILWNVDGLYNLDRKHNISNWLSMLKNKPNIFCLQEIKADGFKLALALELILPKYTQTVAVPMESRGGSVILSHLDLLIESSSSINKSCGVGSVSSLIQYLWHC